MAAPLVPSPLDYIGRRSFGFYPPIRHAEPNSWILGASSWGEIQVTNTKTGAELWIPRQYIGAVGDHREALIVGLTHWVELREGKIVPRAGRRVIEMPRQEAGAATAARTGPATIVGIRLEKTARSAFQSKAFRVGICILFVAGLLALVASASR